MNHLDDYDRPRMRTSLVNGDAGGGDREVSRGRKMGTAGQQEVRITVFTNLRQASRSGENSFQYQSSSSSSQYNARSVTFPQEAARDAASNVDYEERRKSRMKMAEGEGLQLRSGKNDIASTTDLTEAKQSEIFCRIHS